MLLGLDVARGIAGGIEGLCVSRGGTGGGIALEATDGVASDEEGDWLSDCPKARRALRRARWCLDNDVESSSFASIKVRRVSSSGGGFVE